MVLQWRKQSRGIALSGVVLLAPLSCLAQTASQITPQSLAPPAGKPPVAVDIPQGAGPEAPAGAETLEVTLGDLTVQGAPVSPDAMTELRSALLSKRIRVADIFAAARSLEARFARAGRVLVRVTVPPQQLDDGATLRLVVVEGFVERIDASAVPVAVRRRTEAMLARLVNGPAVTLGEIERALLLAGDQPGVQLRSTLAPGSRVGATVLVVEAEYRPVTAQLSLDNNLSESLGRYATSLGFTFNSAFGLGETIYLRAGGYLNTTKGRSILDPDPRNRLLAAGVVLPIGNDGLTASFEAAEARTSPRNSRFQPGFGSRFLRLSGRLRYPLVRRREVTVSVEGSFDAQRERVSIIYPLELPISLDELRVARASVDASAALPWGGFVGVSAQFSAGIDGLGARSAADASPLLPLSRAGTDAAFQKLDFAANLSMPLAPHVELAWRARGQTSFGQVLANAEQIGIATLDDLSPLPSGTLQGDRGFVTRGELQFPFTLADATGVGRLAPYVFSGWGGVRYSEATVLERRSTDATAYGLGMRLGTSANAGTPAVRASAEYGRAKLQGLRGETDRFLFSIASTF